MTLRKTHKWTAQEKLKVQHYMEMYEHPLLVASLRPFAKSLNIPYGLVRGYVKNHKPRRPKVKVAVKIPKRRNHIWTTKEVSIVKYYVDHIDQPLSVYRLTELAVMLNISEGAVMGRVRRELYGVYGYDR